MFGAIQELGVGFVAYSPLGRGFFTSTINSYADLADNDNRKGYPRYKAFEENRPIIDRFKAMAERRGCSPAQLALAFVMSKRPGTVPIPGTKHVKHLLDNLGAASIVLTPAEIAEIDDIVVAAPVVGERYADDPAASLTKGRDAKHGRKFRVAIRSAVCERCWSN